MSPAKGRSVSSYFASANKMSILYGAVLSSAIIMLVLYMVVVNEMAVLPSDWRCLQGSPTAARNNTAIDKKLRNGENEDFTLEQWREKMRRRAQHVADVCKKYGLRRDYGKHMISNIYVEEWSRILFCSIPKVGCSNWKLILLVLSGFVNKTKLMNIDPHSPKLQNLMQLNRYNTEFGIKFRLKHYLKFMFVRHPLERILSAYRDKFESGTNLYFMNKIGKSIVKNFKTNATKMELETGSNVTFTEFLKFLRHSQHNVQIDAHWKPFVDLAFPCTIQYDIIGKYETIDQDANNILRLVSADHVISYPPSQRRTRTSEVVKKYYEKVDKKLLRDVWEIYKTDAEMFNYTSDGFL